ncbi:hypothetical protein OC834_007178 [Tilletia horrida]|nr:hypothetical protein OC834_007178 [Tilletia horrida]KAK0528435.1 hypothetical protein OC835_004670 [Tilletia horrida]
MSWSSAYTITLTGPINIDTVVKKEGRFFGITAQCPSVVGYGHRGDKHSVDFSGRIWCDDDPPQVNDIVQVSCTLLPYATPQLHIEKCAVLCRGELPANFDAPYPIVNVLGQVLAWDAAEMVITLQTGDWDHQTKRRVTVEMLVYRRGRQWANRPEPRVGTIIMARGPIYHQTDVSAKWAIAADAIQPLPVSADAGASGSAPNTPAKKRKYERKNMYSSGSGEGSGTTSGAGEGSGAVEEDEDDGPNAAPSTAADEPTTPTATRVSKGKQRALNK